MQKRIPIDVYCENRIATLPKTYDGLIDYIDISSVDNVEKRILSYQTIEAKVAPSRAKQLLQKGDILVSTVRPNLNAVAVVENETENIMVGSTGYCVLRCKNNIDNRYLFNFCQSQYFIDDMASQATGASYPAVSTSIVRNSMIPLCSIEEQRKISKKMDFICDLISKRKQQLSKLDNLIKSRFIELFGDCTTKVLMGDVISISRGASPRPISSFITDDPNGVNWIKIGDVAENSLYITQTAEKITQAGAKKSRMVYKGDFILSNSMSFGRPYILGINGCVHDGWLILSDFQSTFDELFLYYAIRDDSVQNQFSGKVNGATVKNLNSDLVKATWIAVPPMEQQKQFAAFVEQTDKLKFEVKQSLEKLETMKKALMQQYFG